MSTRQEFALKCKESGLDEDQMKLAFQRYRDTKGPFDDEKQDYVPTLKSVDDIRASLPQDRLLSVMQGGDPDGTLKNMALSDFMSKQYGGVNHYNMLNIGRRIYDDDTLDTSTIYSKMLADQQNPDFKKKLNDVGVYGGMVVSSRRKKVMEAFDSDFLSELKFSMEAPGKGFLKASGSLLAGAMELLPGPLEPTGAIEGLREEIGYLDEYQKEAMLDAFQDGDYGKYLRLTTYNVVGDTFGNLMLMKRGIALANKLTGGSMTLAAKGKTWKSMAGNTAKRASVIAGMNYISTEGTLKDKAESAMLTMMYMNTPIMSSLAGTNTGAILADIALNSGISALYKPGEGFVLGGQYRDLEIESKQMAEEMGDPDAWKTILIGRIIPIAGPDVVFGALSRSVRAQQRAAARGQVNFTESGRIFSEWSKESFDRVKQNMEARYGKDWLTKMDDIDRSVYERARTINANLERGELPPGLVEIDKTVKPRVSIAEMADAGRVWRDENGKLVGEAKVVREVEPQRDVEPQKEVDLTTALADLELSMKSDKRTEVISTDADIGTGRIKPTEMRTGQKASVELEAPRPTEDIGPWTEKSIIYFSRLIEMGEIKNKRDFSEIWDMETRRGDVDPNVIYSEAKKHHKRTMSEIQKAEKASASARITQQQFRRQKEMVLVDSMDIIKDRIRAMQEAARGGKKLGVEQERQKAQAIREIAEEGVKIANEIAPNETSRKRFVIQAQRLKTEKGLGSFVQRITDFVNSYNEKVQRDIILDRIMDDPTKYSAKDANGKHVTKTVAAEYAEAVQDLQDMINTDTSPKSAWRLQQQREALESGKATNLPESILKKLQQTRVDELNTDDLVKIADEIDRLKQVGGTLYVQRQKAWNREVESVVGKIKTTAKAKVDTRAIVSGEREKRRFKGLNYLFRIGALRPWNLVDLMDGGKATYDGAAHKLFIDEANNRYSDYLRWNDMRVSAGEAMIRAQNLSVKDLTRTEFKHGDSKLSLDQLLSVYASSKNRLMHNAVLYGNFKGDVDAYNKAVDTVANNPKWKALADYIVYDYAQNYNRVRKAFIRNENKILGAEENYVPMERMGIEPMKTFEEMSESMFSRDEQRKVLPGRDFTIRRKEVPDSLQKELKLGLYEQWERHTSLQERYINMFDQVKKMNSVLADSALSKQLRDAYGEDFVAALEGYVKAYGNPMSVYDIGTLNRTSRILRKNFATGVLAYNLLTIGKQVPSVLLYLGQGGAKNMVSALDDYNTSWYVRDGKAANRLIDFVEAKDPQVKHAHIERELAELKNADRNKYDKIVSKIGENGMQPIIAMDKMVRTIGWYSTYLKAIQDGKSDQDAITYARNATLRTQPAASAKDLADMYKQGEGWNWMLMFSNQINQIYNIATYQLPKTVARGDLAGSSGIAIGLAVNAFVMHVLTHKDVPDTDDEIVQMILEQTSGKTPVIGSTITSAMSGYDAGHPVLGLLSDSVQAYWSAVQSDDKDGMERAISEIVKNAGTASGLPVNQAVRFGKFADSGDAMELIGGKKNK